MYRKFYGLAEPPFNLTPDSRFLYYSERHREAMANVLYGIEQQKGFILLTGEIGSGKTTIIRSLLSELDQEGVHIAVILQSFLSELELLQAINDEFGLPADSTSKKVLVDILNRFLLEQRAQGASVVVMIDEAQNLSRDALEQLRMLSNLETETDKLVQIVLIGQPELVDLLRAVDLEQLNQRITVRYHLTPLTPDEMVAYIRHRLHVARAHIDIEFTPGALEIIFAYSRGVPRKINKVCDRILLAGYAEGVYVINASIAEAAVAEVDEKTDPAPPPVARKPRKGSWFRSFLTGVGLSLLAFVCIAGSVYLAFLVGGGQEGNVPVIGYTVFPTPTPLPGATPTPTPVPSPSSTVDFPPPPPPPVWSPPAATLAPLDVSPFPAPTPIPTPTPTPTPKDVPPRWSEAQVWRFFEGRVVERPVRYMKVNEPRHALAASFLMLLDRWGEDMDDVAIFRNGGEREARQYIEREFFADNALRVAWLKGVPLDEIMRWDAPFLIQIKKDGPGAATGRFSDYVLLAHAQGEALYVIDPLIGSGVRTVRRDLLADQVEQVLVLYRDPQGWSFVYRGLESESVTSLQDYLRKNEFAWRRSSGIYDTNTASSVEKFQRQFKIKVTGDMDPITCYALALHADEKHPRLFLNAE